MKKNSGPKMIDVAREAGVSIGTVSKVVNGIAVGEEYEKKVRTAIKKLDYQVNTYAQGLKAGRTCTVALLVPNTCHPYFGKLAYYVNLALLRRNYRMLLCCTGFDINKEQEYVNMARQNKVDGIIGLTYNPDLKIWDGISYVSIDRTIGPRIPCIASDNFAGGNLAAEKLAELGCKSVCFLRVGSNLHNEPNKRKAGFENGCAANHLPYEEKILGDGDHLEEFRQFLTDHLHDGKLDFDGIFCVTDGLAWNIMKMLKNMGIQIPENVQIIGFDGTSAFDDQEYLCSTIVQPVRDIADMAVEMLLDKPQSSHPPLVCLPVTYARGGTTRDCLPHFRKG